MAKSEGLIVEQVIRPTGLPDPEIEVRPSLNQIDDLLAEIHSRAEKEERVLVTTLTKRMAEELTSYLNRMGVRCEYRSEERRVGKECRSLLSRERWRRKGERWCG